MEPVVLQTAITSPPGPVMIRTFSSNVGQKGETGNDDKWRKRRCNYSPEANVVSPVTVKSVRSRDLSNLSQNQGITGRDL